jgi:hypothetical protein
MALWISHLPNPASVLTFHSRFTGDSPSFLNRLGSAVSRLPVSCIKQRAWWEQMLETGQELTKAPSSLHRVDWDFSQIKGAWISLDIWISTYGHWWYHDDIMMISTPQWFDIKSPRPKAGSASSREPQESHREIPPQHWTSDRLQIYESHESFPNTVHTNKIK